MSGQLEKVLVVDLVGIDRRRFSDEHTPFLKSLFERYPAQRMDGQPTTEVWPVLVCGVNPGVEGHLLWHARLREKADNPWWARPLNLLPDWIVTAMQLFPHFFKGHDFDMPCIPHWRRRQMDYHRLKYYVRSEKPEKYNVVGGAKSMFHVMGEDAYHEVVWRFEDLDAAADKYPTDHRLQFLELHCFDLSSHWYLDEPDYLAGLANQVDRCVEKLAKHCEERGVTLVLLMEHGQERVPRENHVNLRKIVAQTGVSRKDFCYYNGVAVSRFWFRTDEAREKISAALKEVPNSTVLTCEELNERCEMTLSPEWGELYIARDSGYLFHPNDYYHPLANIVVGLKQKAMRKRMFDPYHRGYHGYLPGPDAPSENAWSLVVDDRVKPTSDEARMKDFAPSMLNLLGVPTPDYMAGKPAYRFTTEAPEEGAASAGQSVIESAVH